LLPIIPKYDWYLTGISALLLAIGIYLVIDRSQQGKRPEHRRHYTHLRAAYDAMSLITLVGLVLLMTGFFKYKPMVILSDSMMPLYGRGSMVIVNAIDSPLDVQVGDIIQFRGTDKVITHRVQSIEQADDGSGGQVFITKGDNNPSRDPPVPAKEVMGIVKAQVPYVGYPTVWLRSLAK
jgi:signal peptidase